MSIVLQLGRRRSQQVHFCLLAQPPLRCTARQISHEDAHEGGLQQPPYSYGTVGLHMLTIGSTHPSEHPHQAREEAPPDMGWLDSHVLVRDLNEHGDADGTGD